MAFQKWVQDNFVQSGVFAPIVELLSKVKLIFKAPNLRPFKKSTVIGEFTNSRIDIITAKNVIAISEFTNGSVGINTSKNVRCDITLLNKVDRID